MLGTAATTLGTGWAPAIKREEALLEDDESRLRDFCMLNLDGIAASMASIESALCAITTNESIGCTLTVLAKTLRLQEMQQSMHQPNALSMCVAKNCSSTPWCWCLCNSIIVVFSWLTQPLWIAIPESQCFRMEDAKEAAPVSSWQKHITSPGTATARPHAMRQVCPEYQTWIWPEEKEESQEKEEDRKKQTELAAAAAVWICTSEHRVTWQGSAAADAPCGTTQSNSN